MSIVYDMPAKDYFASTALGSSGLKTLIKRTALHYWAKNLDPKRPPRKETAAQRAGSLVHMALLESKRWEGVTVMPKLNLTRKADKEALVDFARTLYAEPVDGYDEAKAIVQRARERHLVVDEAEREITEAISASVLRHPMAAHLLKGCSSEVSAFWTDPHYGVECRARFDVQPRSEGAGGILVDLKKCQDASPEGFARHVLNYGYHYQAAHYIEGWEAHPEELGEMKGYAWIAVEEEYPHAVATYYAPEDVLELGRSGRAGGLEKLAAALSCNQWPGFSAEIKPIRLPAWAA